MDKDNYIKSGIIHKIIASNIKNNINNFNNSYDMVLYIEDLIKQYTKKYNNSGIAFPVGICINDICAHHSPNNITSQIIKDDDLIKIDYGVHIDGYITDGAFSYCHSGKYNELIEISKNATNIGIKYSGIESVLSDIGYYIQEYIESKEILINDKSYQVKSIYDLCGHQIDRYNIHSGKAVPNIYIPYFERMKQNEVYAIETFPTLGNGEIINDNNICNHFMLLQNDINNSNINEIYKDRNKLPFCDRWYNFKIPYNENIKKYPLIKTKDKTIVAQYEKSIYIDENVKILN